MSFIPFIRDYIELLNTVYDSFSNDINLQRIVQETILYLAQTIKFLLIYFITFQWFRDILYLPVLIPQISSSILKETFFLQGPLENTFTILDIPLYNSNKFFIGFLNSFFLSLPLSCAHLIYVRRLLIQGNVAGIAAGLGNIFGQLLFIGSVIFGFRFLLIPWFLLEPFTYVFGVILLLAIIYDMVHERVIKIIEWTNKSAILKIFFLNFILIWTEQSCIFQYLGNLTFTSDSSIIESFPATTSLNFFSTNIFYLSGLFCGSLLFTAVFGFFLKTLTEFLQVKFSILRSTWILRLNICLLTITIAFTFTSIPFYGLDYLLTQPLGFISQDKSFKNTIFSPNEIKDPFGMLGGFSYNLSLDTDVNAFDRGFYLKAPIFQTFEDLNYSGEYASTVRQGNIPLFDQYKEKARKIRDILVKKPDLEAEKNSSTNNIVDINASKIAEKNATFFEYPTYYPTDRDFYRSYNIEKRFENHYKEAPNFIFENIVVGSLNNVFSNEKFTVANPELNKKLKQKYYANPIYKFLLTSEIDTFLKRQPTEYLLSPKEEADLYKKRLILNRYTESLRFYNTIPYIKDFQYFFNGSKSFADRVYNQQFKGTLHIVRRLFSISADSGLKNPQELVIKYDQPLFKRSLLDQENLSYHEELQNYIDSRTLDPTEAFKQKTPMFELVSQSPLYIGWDEDLRKMVVTNRLLNRSITNFIEPQGTKQSERLNDSDTEIKSIQFTTWPSTKNQLEEPHSKVLFNSRILFQTKNSLEKLNYNRLVPLFVYNDKESGISYYEALPNNIVKLTSSLVDVIPPNRGGFIWPGNSSLKFSMNDIFS